MGIWLKKTMETLRRVPVPAVGPLGLWSLTTQNRGPLFCLKEGGLLVGGWKNHPKIEDKQVKQV